jgi:Lipid A 3-O-deacylase (PagL)
LKSGYCFMVVLTAIFWQLAQTQAWGFEVEAGGGRTVGRYGPQYEAPMLNVNLISQVTSRFPTEWSLGYILAQDKNPAYLHNDKPTLWLGVSKRLRWKALFLGIGLVAIDQPNQRISSYLNFKSEGGFQLGPVVATVQHISNAGLKGFNDGETLIICSYRFQLGE